MSTTPPDFAAINAAFQALSPAEKRRAIARDVLERLERGQLKPQRGNWVIARRGLLDVDNDADLQSVLAESDVVCQVCAIGGAICAMAHFEDALTHRNAHFKAVSSRLFDLLGEEQTRLMECAFEQGWGEYLARDLELHDEAVHFGNRYPDAIQRFLAIWTAIAEHPEGLFDVVGLNAAAQQGAS